MSRRDSSGFSANGLRGQGVRIAIAVIAALAAYFLTIQDIKTTLATKADAAALQRIDVKLSRVELIEEENHKANAEFRVFREEVIERLARIESLLEQMEGKR